MFRLYVICRYNENIRKENSYSIGGNHLKPNRSSDRTLTPTTMGIKDLDALTKTIKRKSQEAILTIHKLLKFDLKEKKFKTEHNKRFTFKECSKAIQYK